MNDLDVLKEVNLLVEPQQGSGYEAILRCAFHAEKLGFGGVFTSDHFVRVGDGDPGAGPLDVWLLLAALAVQVPRIRLGSLVSPITFRNPVGLAVAAAQIDQMSGGRIELGVGAGWFAAEHLALGVGLPPVRQRMDALDEALRVIHGAWAATSDGVAYSFDGRHWRVDGWPGGPVPVQRPHPPVIVGGVGPVRTIDIATTHADEYNVPFQTPDQVCAAFDRARRAASDKGRATPRLSATIALYAGTTRLAALRRIAKAAESVEELPDFGGFGTVSKCAEILDGYWSTGAERIYLQIVDAGDLAHIELLAEACRISLDRRAREKGGAR
ncbi:LLM class flavin-dependent oxidoreductase [Nocardia sp. NPDC051929]|uniref:LLM class flavin-dependent oxidoreductase n=1 Tax=Nocardia sp. NPDC051929 TaxID=3364327 RepID=UPI0037C95DEC